MKEVTGDRVGLARGDHLHVGQVARGQLQVPVDLVGDDEHPLESDFLQLLRQEPGLGLVDAEILDDANIAGFGSEATA